jgi:5-formyltetrahydrofolate cyclo-ligase
MVGQLPSAEQKAQLRSAILTRRDALTAGEADAASRALCERLEAFSPLSGYGALAGYAPIRNEIDATPFLKRRLAAGGRVYFPRVRGEHDLVFVPVDGLEELSRGAFGVPEPAGEPAPIAQIEAFLVPGLAFDRHGRRLGFGGGFYDRALADALEAPPQARQTRAHAPLLVGICYAWQVLDDEIPFEPHDISMDVIATDEQIIRSARRRLT